MKPLIIESNSRILLEKKSTVYEEVKEKISDFLELNKSLNFFNIYSLSHLSIWNGYVKGFDNKKLKKIFEKYSKFPIPKKVIEFIEESYKKFNLFKLESHSDKHDEIICSDQQTMKNILGLLAEEITENIIFESGKYLLSADLKGIFKSVMIDLGYPVNDLTLLSEGEPLKINFKPNFKLRHYQVEARDSFINKSNKSQSSVGLVVLPCGAGKTVVGISILVKLATSALIITPNVVALRQWRKEILDKTDLDPSEIGEYSGVVKEIKKITLTTYQILTYRDDAESQFHHLFLFQKKNWGFIIYDEIHMLPAKVFRYVSSVQSKRRLGLTATLVREDGNEKQVFSLVGPKKYDIGWKDLEEKNYLAKANCYEVKVGMDLLFLQRYHQTKSEKEKYRLACINKKKIGILKNIIDYFADYQIIIIGQFIEQLEEIKKSFGFPLLTGKTNYEERQKIFKDFNERKVNKIIVSKIANFAIDLPNAEVGIQVSGNFGSRQEEAQRLGRIIRPKKSGLNNAYFISLVTQFTKEDFLAQNRKGFLTSQGYQYITKKENELDFIL